MQAVSPPAVIAPAPVQPSQLSAMGVSSASGMAFLAFELFCPANLDAENAQAYALKTEAMARHVDDEAIKAGTTVRMDVVDGHTCRVTYSGMDAEAPFWLLTTGFIPKIKSEMKLACGDVVSTRDRVALACSAREHAAFDAVIEKHEVADGARFIASLTFLSPRVRTNTSEANDIQRGCSTGEFTSPLLCGKRK